MTPFFGVIILLLFYLSYLMGLTAGGQEAWFMRNAAAIIYINIGLLFWYHKKWNLENLLYWTGLVFFGFAMEMVAAKTNMLYGEYSFGPSLGPKVAGVPYAVGFYWLMLSYSSACAAAKMKLQSTQVRTVVAATLQTSLAMLIFQLAVKLKFWSIAVHEQSQIRYALVYFGFALVLQSIFGRLKIDASNKIAPYVYMLLWVFFFGLWMFVKY